MIPELSDDENVRILIEQFEITEVRARFIIALERGQTEGDVEAVDGPLTEEKRQRFGLGRSILDQGNP